MWLLNCQTTQLESFEGDDRPPYAILSHRWEGKEVIFQDVMDGRHTELEGWQKIKACCEQAKRDGLDYVWADTCCIDKRSSAELSEAINSMYKWYQQARICYAYLADVESDEALVGSQETDLEITNSVWFTRGWTLQELLAPKNLIFYDRCWRSLGTKKTYAEAIEHKTCIPVEALVSFQPHLYCIAQRMSWAAGRETTRVEDRTYSLLGLFDINMPLLYGEGDKAFQRLQNELIQTSTDDSVYAWSVPPIAPSKLRVLASSPDCYRWNPLYEFIPNAIQSSVSKEGVTGRFYIWPLCFDVIAASIGDIRHDNGAVNHSSRKVVMFLVKVSQNLYQRVLLDGSGCEVIRTHYNLDRSQQREKDQNRTGFITIQFKPVLTRLSNILYRKSQKLDQACVELAPGLLGSAKLSKDRNKQGFMRSYLKDKSLWRQGTNAQVRPLVVKLLPQVEDSEICLVLRLDDQSPSGYLMIVFFSYDFVSAPSALVYIVDGYMLGYRNDLKLTDWSNSRLPEVYQNVHLRVSAYRTDKSCSGWNLTKDNEALMSAFYEIDKEKASGVRLQQIAANIKVAFVPKYGGYQVLLAFREYINGAENIPREWLYPPSERS